MARLGSLVCLSWLVATPLLCKRVNWKSILEVQSALASADEKDKAIATDESTASSHPSDDTDESDPTTPLTSSGFQRQSWCQWVQGWRDWATGATAIATGSMGGPRRVAIFADYDGCWDLPCAASQPGSQLLKNMTTKWEAKVEDTINRHTVENVNKLVMTFVREKIIRNASEVTLFIGSNRQCDELEELNQEFNKNGHALTELRNLAKRFGWKFNPARLADRMPAPQVARIFRSGSDNLKLEMVHNLFKELHSETDVYFFDDAPDYLFKALKEARIPPHIHFHIVYFDYAPMFEPKLVRENYDEQLALLGNRTR